MLRPRIIPCLLLSNGALVKTICFKSPKYIGDPLNAVRIFNDKQADELIFIDIEATALKKEPDYKLIRDLARECRMPLCYGGGVKTADDVERLINLGVEKVAVSSAAIRNPLLVKDAAKRVGSQSVVVVLDVRKNLLDKQGYEVYTHNGEIGTGMNPMLAAKMMEEQGAGEIVVNSIDRDGTQAGYDLEIIELVRNVVKIPLTALGGAGKIQHIADLFGKYGIIGAAAGSMFVFKGKYKAVLIQYLDQKDRNNLFRNGAADC